MVATPYWDLSVQSSVNEGALSPTYVCGMSELEAMWAITLQVRQKEKNDIEPLQIHQ